MYDNTLVAIAPHTMGDNMLFDTTFASYNDRKGHESNSHFLAHPQDTLDEQSQSSPCNTPNTIPDTDSISPKQQVRRTSGRRPLSILSNSSLNSNPELYPSLDTRSPDPWSPGRHRRHRSVIGASVDYRSYYPQGNPMQGRISPNIGSSAFHPPHTLDPNSYLYSPVSHFPHNPNEYNNGVTQHSLQQNPSTYLQSTNQQSTQHASQFTSYSPSMTSNTSSPQLDAPMRFESVQQNGLDNVFVILAYKERQVLEAKQSLAQAQEDLEHFRRHMSAMLQPNIVVVPAPLKPSIISPRQRLGINSLQFSPIVSDNEGAPPKVLEWHVDMDMSSALNDEFEEIRKQFTHTRGHFNVVVTRDGVALSVIKCLLGVVKFFISTFPVQQQNITFEHASKSVIVGWKAQYPLPMDSMYGHFLYEA